jgi:hypothetical protein
MTCFEIAHHPRTSDLWASSPNFKYKPDGRDTRLSNEKKAYVMCTSHPLYVQLRREYGLDVKSRKNIADSEEEKIQSD